MAFFLLIPIFWIFLIPTIRNEYLDVQNMKTQINNALEVWSDDLQDKKVILQKLLEGDRYWG